MTLTEKLLQANNANREKIPNEFLEIMDAATNDLKAKNLAESALKVGDTISNTTLPNAAGEEVALKNLWAEGPLVISFYRGGWCPYCNIELKALQESLSQFKELGANLVAITPETPDNSLTTSEKNELSFSVLTDKDNVYAKELGLVIQLPEDLIAIYNQFGINVEKHNGNTDNELPMPATFVVDTNGKVVYSFINEDYTKRGDVEDILTALKAL